MSTKSCEFMGKSSSIDRISNLPEEVRQHILSFLSTTDAIRTSILSSTWRYVWITLPFLDFGQQFWENTKYSKSDCYLDADRLYHDIYIDFNNVEEEEEEGNLIDCTDSSLRTGALGFVLLIDQTVRIIKNNPRNQTREIHLFLPNDAEGGDDGVSMDIVFSNGDELRGLSDLIYVNRRGYKFKLSSYLIASSNLLIGLHLRVFSIFKLNKSEERMPIKLPLLRKLTMTSIKKNIDQEVVDYLLRSCSTELEELDLRSFNRNSWLLEIKGFPRLWVLQVHIHGLESLHIDAPDDLHSLSLGYEPEECAVNSTLFDNLVKMKVEDSLLSIFFFNYGLPGYTRLESLHLIRCSGLTHINICSKSLTNLVISMCNDLTQIEMDTPNLKSFSLYTGVIVSLLCKTPVAPPNAFIFFDSHSTSITENTKLLTEFVECQTSAFYGPGNEGMITPPELRENSSPLLSGVQHLHVFLNFPGPPTPQTFSQYVRVMLQLCPHPKTLVVSTTRCVEEDYDWNLVGCEDRQEAIKSKFEYRYKEIDEVACGCSRCYPWQPFNCRRHSLKDFTLTLLIGTSSTTTTEAYQQSS